MISRVAGAGRDTRDTWVDAEVERRHRETLPSTPDELPPEVTAERGEDPLVDQLVDERYRITGLVAVGGMGCIYDALDEREGERVALKTLQPRFAERPRVVGRFLREAQALARAHSPHIVSISAHGRLPDGRAYYVMELMRGQTLSDAIEGAGGPLEPVRAVRLAQQIAAGLGHAHAIGMVHRDLKPENVFLCELEGGREHVKILDFGLAKALDGSMDVTVGGEVLGTPCYMAPEQVFGRRADARTDVYACGVVLYEMLTGRVPFDGEAAVDIMRAHVEEAPRPPSQLDPPVQIPVLLEWIIMCCLYKDPGKRFQSAAELADELDAAARLYGLG